MTLVLFCVIKTDYKKSRTEYFTTEKFSSGTAYSSDLHEISCLKMQEVETPDDRTR